MNCSADSVVVQNSRVTSLSVFVRIRENDCRNDKATPSVSDAAVAHVELSQLSVELARDEIDSAVDIFRSTLGRGRCAG